MAHPGTPEEHGYGRWLAALLLVLLALRVAALVTSDLNLYADEAQYWRWGQELAWGYYSKPPLVAWVIAASTALFGDVEWAVRLAAPFLHTIAAVALFFLGRAMYDARTGFFAALGYILMPGVIVSSAVISTDGVLLPVFSVALLMLWRLRSGEGSWWSAAALGVAIGTGFLAKYAMLYFALGCLLTLVLDQQTRSALLNRRGALALGVAAVIFAPHLVWNAANEFQTVGHTVDNANLGGPLLNPNHLPKFLADQMGVFGPIGFLALIGGLYPMLRSGPDERRRRDRWLLAFILPVLIIIASQAVLSRAHANWAATAYPAASVLVAAWLLRAQANAWLWIGVAALTGLAFQLAPDLAAPFKLALGVGFAAVIIGFGALFRFRPVGLLVAAVGLHAIVSLGVAGLTASPPQITAALGLDNALKRIRGWEETSTSITAKAREVEATAILVDEREIWHGVDYYARQRLDVPLIAWRRNPGIKSFSEQQPLNDAIDDRVLVASFRPGFRPRIRADFETFEYVGEDSVSLGVRANGCPIERRIVFYLASGHAPLERDADWEARFDGLSERPPPPCPAGS